tara:strand:+ start:67 stop:966 length:900 start_codon:yes stop_codon:yes gene_type:complete
MNLKKQQVKMLSILIPCYNFNVINLVRDILQQAKLINIKFEIICIEDGSTKKFSNAELKKMENVIYEENKENVGRSKIRNILSKKAKFKWLLFIDCDSKINNQNFLLNYTQRMSELNTIFYGDTEYSKKHKNHKNILHWLYGKKIESKRKKNQFCSHHFLIEKKVFNHVSFDENIDEYGHEDTIFAIELKLKKYKVIYINNTLLHIGLDDNDKFIKKTKESINNLIILNKKYNLNNLRIIKTYNILSYLFLNELIVILFESWENKILQNLRSAKPKLIFFQFYKLGYYCQTLKRLENSK